VIGIAPGWRGTALNRVWHLTELSFFATGFFSNLRSTIARTAKYGIPALPAEAPSH
jgi:hypothetical protein